MGELLTYKKNRGQGIMIINQCFSFCLSLLLSFSYFEDYYLLTLDNVTISPNGQYRRTSF